VRASRLALLAAGLFVGLGLAEVALRIHPVVPGQMTRALDADNTEAACTANSLTRGWEPIPGTCGRDAHGTFLHGQPDAPRAMLVLGDSVTAGDHWVARAAAALIEEDPGLRVHNAAVSGYDTCQELETWRQLGPVLQPELVVLQTCPNDVLGSHALVPLTHDHVRYHLHHDDGRRAAVDFPLWVLHSRLLSLAVLSWGQATAEPIAEDPALSEGFARHCLLLLKEEVQASGADLVAIAFPVLLDRPSGFEEERLRSQESAIRQALRDNEVPTLPVRSLLPSPLSDTRSMPDDLLHPSIETHWALAPDLATFLRHHSKR